MKRMTFLFLNLFVAGLLFSQTLITVDQFNAGITREDANFIYSRVNGQNFLVDKSTRRDYRIQVNSAWRSFDIEAQNAGGFQYTVRDRAITITGYTGTATAIVIPPTINGMPVVAIGEYAFSGHKAGYFYNDVPPGIGLTSVTIPNSITTIGGFAFSGNRLGNVIIPLSITSIGDRAFWDAGLSSITIHNSVTYIGLYAFYSNQLTNVTIPDSVTNIEPGAFGRNNIVSVSIGTGLRLNPTGSGIGSAFRGQRGRTLTAINVAAGNPVYASVDGVVYNKNLTTLIFWPEGKPMVNIPSSVTTIGRDAFFSNISSITIPNNVTVIEGTDRETAFICYNLVSITIGENVTINGLGFSYANRVGSLETIGFKEAYNNGGRRAGTYTRPNTDSTTWIRQ